jgi:hypothetical protein
LQITIVEISTWRSAFGEEAIDDHAGVAEGGIASAGPLHTSRATPGIAIVGTLTLFRKPPEQPGRAIV